VNRKLLSNELRRISVEEYAAMPSSGIVVVLDNIRSSHNVGSAFRTADAFKADKVYLCGICDVPPSAQIHKTALGAEMSVPWEHRASTLEAVKELRENGWTIVGVEQTENSVSLEKFQFSDGRKYAFIFGNEVDGVDQKVIDASDFTLEIPQLGTKHSLNVSVSVGIVLWKVVEMSKMLKFAEEEGR